ncbi:MAG: phosphoglycerate kinase [Patescibacteria group bacterium]
MDENYPISLSGKKVLLRLDLNLPAVGDDYRLQAVLPTIQSLAASASRVVVVSHLGVDGSQSLVGVAKRLNDFLPITFVADWSALDDPAAFTGRVVLAENLRRDPGEMTHDEQLARRLAGWGDVFINDAFASSHRRHASIVGVPKFLPTYLGPRFKLEVAELSRAFQPDRPFVVILGGAKFSTKLPLVDRLLKTADQIFVVGALAHAYFTARGYSVGQSLLETSFQLPASLIVDPHLIWPSDVLLRDGGGVTRATRPAEVSSTDTIVDVGPETTAKIAAAAKLARLVIWNGPLGLFENGYGEATAAVAQAVASSVAHSIVGGGDTVAAVRQFNNLDNFDFVSTGGGAMLEFLATGTLPGLEAING